MSYFLSQQVLRLSCGTVMPVRLCVHGCKAFEIAVMGQQCDKAEHGTNTYSAEIKSLLSASPTKTRHNATGKLLCQILLMVTW